MRNINDYELYIVDMDGTMYYQRPLRIRMILELAFYYIFRIHRIKELLIIREYRKIKENWNSNNPRVYDSKKSGYRHKEEYNRLDVRIESDSDIEQIIIKMLANSFSYRESSIRDIIEYWMVYKPSRIICKYMDTMLVKYVDKVRGRGKRVVIYSDNPADVKIKAMNVEVDGVYCGTSALLSCIKPSPDGIVYIMKEQARLMRGDNYIDKNKVLMIGDRADKDGEAAKEAGIDFLILSKSKKIRVGQLGSYVGVYE